MIRIINPVLNFNVKFLKFKGAENKNQLFTVLMELNMDFQLIVDLIIQIMLVL